MSDDVSEQTSDTLSSCLNCIIEAERSLCSARIALADLLGKDKEIEDELPMIRCCDSTVSSLKSLSYIATRPSLISLGGASPLMSRDRAFSVSSMATQVALPRTTYPTDAVMFKAQRKSMAPSAAYLRSFQRRSVDPRVWRRPCSVFDVGKFKDWLIDSFESESLNSAGDGFCVWKVVRGKFMLPILNPETFSRMIWILFGILFTVFEALAIPVYLSFHVEPVDSLLYFSFLMDIYFICDIPLQFFTGFLDSRGIVIYQFKVIIIRYLRSWFIFDLVAAIPWELISISTGDKNTQLGAGTKGARFIRLIKLLRLMRLIRLAKISRYVQMIEHIVESNRGAVFFIEVLKLIMVLALLIHWFGCAWNAVGVNAEPDDLSWIKKLPSGLDTPDTERYIWSVYYTLTTMVTVGYGDISPTSFHEVQFVIFLLCVCAMVYSTLIGILLDLIASLRSQSRDRNEKRIALALYMKWRAVPKETMLRIRQYLMYRWESGEGFEQYERRIREQLPGVLQAELCFHIYGKALKSAPFMSWISSYNACLKKLSSLVTSHMLDKDDYVFRKGGTSDRIFFVNKGQIHISLNEKITEENDELAVNRGGTMAKRLFHYLVSDVALETHSSAYVHSSDIFEKVADEMREHDRLREKSAILLQRRFRRLKMMMRLREVTQEATKGYSTMRMPSETVFAPAYLGESCLWVPFQQWETAEPFTYLYSARCKTRVEMMILTQKAVKDVIDAYSPWLADRFEHFQQAVMDEFKAASGLSLRNTARSRTYVGSPEVSPKKSPQGTTPKGKKTTFEMPEMLPPGAIADSQVTSNSNNHFDCSPPGKIVDPPSPSGVAKHLLCEPPIVSATVGEAPFSPDDIWTTSPTFRPTRTLASQHRSHKAALLRSRVEWEV